MQQTVIKVGNSLAITVPNAFAKGRKLKAGQKVFVQANSDFDIIQISTKQTPDTSLTPEFFNWLNKFNEKYKKGLTALAKK